MGGTASVPNKPSGVPHQKTVNHKRILAELPLEQDDRLKLDAVERYRIVDAPAIKVFVGMTDHCQSQSSHL